MKNTIYLNEVEVGKFQVEFRNDIYCSTDNFLKALDIANKLLKKGRKRIIEKNIISNSIIPKEHWEWRMNNW